MSSQTTIRIAMMKDHLHEWDTNHIKLNGSPTSNLNGRNYLAHAILLLDFVSPICELNPIAKAVVGCVENLLTLEQNRKENEARIAVVFLAVSDVLRVLADVDNILLQGSVATNFETVLKRVEDEVIACGNSADTYYQGLRLAKFLKSQAWKKRILEHIQNFDKCRRDLQEVLTIQTAFGNRDLMVKLDFLIAGLFASKYDWEKDVDRVAQVHGPLSAWINDPNVLQSLISATKDPSLSTLTLDEKTELSIVNSGIKKVQKELVLDLDEECRNNKVWFERKLNLHAEQTHQVIMRSAHMVIETLSGPYDRLYNEDLKELWKEMNWIFCVETTMFTKALLEYYVDRFFVSSAASQGQAKNHAADNVSTPSSTSNVPLQSRHADLWTLKYIAQGDQIGLIIDSDRSGYVRISEANSLTIRMPEGYNLPQWCAYLVAGLSYENRVYRSRIGFLLLKLTEMQAIVVPANTSGLLGCLSWIVHSVGHAFCRHPQGQDNSPVPPELRKLVKERIIAQDADLRTKLDSLNWTIRDESAFQLLREEPLEKYILPFCAVLLEYIFDISHLGTSYAISQLDWDRIFNTFLVVRTACAKQILDVVNGPQNIATYMSGLWSLFEFDPMDLSTVPPYTLEENEAYLSDLSQVAVDFPLSPTAGVQPYLQEPPQECEERASTYKLQGVAGWSCNRCKAVPDEKRHNCLYCPDFDLCQSCYSLPVEQHSVETHTYQHPISLQSIFLNKRQRRLMLLPDAEVVMSRLLIAVLTEKDILDSDMTAADKDEISTRFGFHHTCYRCTKPLSLDFTFYVCIGHTCQDCFLCQGCAQKDDDVDTSAEHHFWHTLLEVRRDIIVELTEELRLPMAPEVGSQVDDQSKGPDNSSHDDTTHIIVPTKSALEEKLELNHAQPEGQRSVLESKLGSVEERISRLEDKVDSLLLAIQALSDRLPVSAIAL